MTVQAVVVREAVKHRRPLLKAGLTALTALCVVGVMLVQLMLGTMVAFGEGETAATTCTITGVTQSGAGVTANVATIAKVGASMGVAEAGQIIAIATTLVETGGRNLASLAVPESARYPNDGVAPGDHDSVGLFQQRASWGSVQQRMDPIYSSTKFYERLLSFDWQSMDPGAAAQKVQVSAFPDRYATKMAEATALLASSGGGGAVAAQCPVPEAVPLDGAELPPGFTLPAGTSPAATVAVSFALAQRGKPYVWGAIGPNSYDCSGLTMTSWRQAGVTLGRVTGQQVRNGTPTTINALLPGDLVFPHPGHMGMYVGSGLVVHAPQTGDVVKITPLTSFTARGVYGLRHIA